MSIITLLTDFGTEDEYAGVMKGVILSINPSATVIDISHRIDPQDLLHGAYVIEASYGYFPRGTVHLIIVDPGVGSNRRILAIEKTGHIFIAPDNGILTLLLKGGPVDAIVHLENSRYFLDPVSQTFHGRDIFAPVGANISMGADLKKMGRPVDQAELTLIDIEEPIISDKGDLTGIIVSIDHFGNLITNIGENTFNNVCGTHKKKELEIRVDDHTIKGISCSYGGVKNNNPLAIMGSRGYLEIAVNRGSAKNYFNAKKGDRIIVVFRD